jgi:hypothetical protein
MSPVEKALWYIEGNLGLDISLADIAAAASGTRHHLLRAFAAATGLSVMRYVRGRRLSEAAQRLAGGAGDILSVAIDAGYNSPWMHREHIAGIRRTWDAIWNGWLPRSGHEVADAPLLERYDGHFHPRSGRGGFSLLIPLS